MLKTDRLRAHRARTLLLILVLPLLLASCGDDTEAPTRPGDWLQVAHPLLDRRPEVPVDEESAASMGVAGLLDATASGPALDGLSVDYPLPESVFPPDFASPTFLWHDETEGVDTWLVRIELPGADGETLRLLVAGPHPVEGEIDPAAVSDTNEVYRFTPHQASARSWRPSNGVWARIREQAGRGDVRLRLVGFASSDPATALSSGSVSLRVSKDRVRAPVFYRDVPLMPAVGEAGSIQPLSRSALPLINWRIKDLSQPGSRVVMTGMPSCANCHSFSKDGRTLAMDVDGPEGDKGMYAIAPLEPTTTIDSEQVITWNSFPGKPEGHKTIGFLSRVSPNGKFVISTVNEALYTVNFPNHRFLQVFFPTRGILVYHSTETGRMRALPGANDPNFVHCDGVWTPDGKMIVFARARAKDPYEPDRPLATFPNDPNETQIQYDLYRMPFNGGRGGKPVPIEGASANGMSNTFPKVSPDGRWVVFTQCQNGQLMRPDGRLWIVPLQGGEPREMRCNTSLMNSWHSFSPNGRWMVFSSKVNRPYTQMFLTHIDEDGNDTPPILIEDATAANRAVNIPEFLNRPYEFLQEIAVPAVNHHLWFQQGDTLLREGKLEDAQPLLEKAIAEVPDFSRAHASLALVHDRQGRPKKAREHYEKALEVDERNPHILTNLGRLLLQDGEVDEAMRLWRRAIAVNPHESVAHNNLGMVLASKDRLDEAEKHFRRAAAEESTLLPALKNLGVLALRRERPEEAIHHFEAALGVDPQDAKTRGRLVNLLLQAGRTRDLLPHLEYFVAQREDDARARTLLAWTLATTGEDELRDGSRALALAERAVALTSRKDPAALDALGAALAETGEFERAVEAAEAAARLVDAQDPRLASEIRARKGVYEGERPYREPR